MTTTNATRRNVMTMAHQIRRDAATQHNCNASEINFSECLRMAWARIRATASRPVFNAQDVLDSMSKSMPIYMVPNLTMQWAIDAAIQAVFGIGSGMTGNIWKGSDEIRIYLNDGKRNSHGHIAITCRGFNHSNVKRFRSSHSTDDDREVLRRAARLIELDISTGGLASRFRTLRADCDRLFFHPDREAVKREFSLLCRAFREIDNAATLHKFEIGTYENRRRVSVSYSYKRRLDRTIF